MFRFKHRSLVLAALATLAGGLIVPATGATPVAAATAPAATLPTDDPANWTPNVLNGQVNSIWQFGNKVIIGGTFTQVANATSNGGATYNQAYLAAFDAATGVIDPNFDPVLSNAVEVIIPGNTAGTFYVGGDFNTIDGVNRRKVARLNLSDGSLTSFNAGGANARVRDLRLVGNTLYVAGLFTTIGSQPRTYLASLNGTTGAVTNDLNLTLSGLHNGGVGKVIKIDVTPDGSRMLITGNFTSVDGQARGQVALIDLSTAPASLSPWQTNWYTHICASAFDSYTRDLDISPDGTYAIITTTGAYRANLSCDTASRFELTTEVANVQPTWVNYTGGDTLYAVEIHDGVAYIGGHQRWFNNPFAADRQGAGGVSRPGMGAVDVVTGLPFSWNPTRTRGVGLFDYHVTPQGIWAGSDTDRFNNELRMKLAFFPWTGGKNVPVNDIGTLPNDVFQLGQTTGTTGNVDQTVLYRVNAGGPALASVDDGPDWLADNTSTSIYRTGGSSTATAPSSLNTPRNDATVPRGDFDRAPGAIWTTERWDALALPNMQWAFPVAAGTPITVRLYLANRSTSTDDLGERVFHVDLDGTRVLDSLDLSGTVGHDIGTMRAFDIVSDGTVNIDFLHGAANNPLINGIEIIRRDISPSGTLGTQDSVIQRSYDGVGAPTGNVTLDGTTPWRRVRGAFMVNSTLFTIHVDGTIMTRSLDGNTFGPGTALNMWANNIIADAPNMTGIFFDPATSRIYYTISGQSSLFSRSFLPESGVPHAIRSTAGGNIAGLNPTRVRGMFIDGESLYFADATSGNLLRMGWSGGAPSGSPVVVDSTVDWRGRALFRSSGAQPNVPPVAVADANCSGHTCDFVGTASTDSDGAIVSYAWDFGNGVTATGATVSYAYPAGGVYSVTLTVTDDRGGVGTDTVQVTVSDPPNVPPTASATGVCNLLSCTFDGSGSADSDGTIVSYAWNFGDGTTGTGVVPTKVYAAAGTYPVTLTVTDDDGATATSTLEVQTVDPGAAAQFRATATANSSTANANVTVPAAVQAGDQLVYIVTANTNTTATTPAGWTLLGTRQDGNPDMTSWVFTRTADATTAGTTVSSSLGTSSKVSRVLAAYANATPPVAVQSSVMGASSVNLTTPGAPVPYSGSAVISYWSDKSSGNGGWTLPVTVIGRADSVGSGTGRITAALADAKPLAGDWPGANAVSQVAGTKGIGWTIVMAPATANNAPVATFTSSCASLSCTFDGSASSDSDGSIVAYNWDFGNGTSGSGATAGTTYAGEGTYTVTLTVTDDRGAATSTSANVTVGLAVVAFRDAASANVTTANASIVVPPTVVPGDQLLLFITTNTATTATTPAGWTLLGTAQAGTPDVRSWVFTRTAVAGTAGVAVQSALGASSKTSIVLVAYANAAPITSAVAATSPAPAATMTSPPIEVITNGSQVVSYWVDKTSGNNGWTLPANVVARASSIGSGSGRVTAAAGDTAVVAGTWPGATATSTTSGTKAIAWTVVVPAP
jgi:PKD repeat protein